MKLIFGEEEEKSRGLMIFGSIMIAGAAMILAKPIAFWIMGITYDENAGVWYKDKNGNGAYDSGEELDSLECRLEALEKVVSKENINLNIEVPRVILEKKPLDVRVNEDELLGRIILLVREGFFDGGRTASEVANELMRRCWHPKDLQHVRPTLEQLTALGF